MSINQLKLTQEQKSWLTGWLELWGAWIYTGRIDKRQSSIIAQYMATLTPSDSRQRPICCDDDGMLICRVVDAVLAIDKTAFGLLLSRYVYCLSNRAIANYYHKTAQPRAMRACQGLPTLRKPSLKTCLREVSEILDAAEYLIYFPLQNAFIERENAAKMKKRVANVLTSSG